MKNKTTEQLSELYRLKGKLVTDIEVTNAQLTEVNQKIVAALNDMAKLNGDLSEREDLQADS